MSTSDPRVEREAAIAHLLQRLWTYSISTKSDDARALADEIAEAAARGMITTEVVPNGAVYGRIWKPTPDGLSFLYNNSALLADEEARYVEVHARG